MIIPILLFLSSFLFYLCTLSGTVPAYRDSGDLINAIYTLGIAHPPGYPFYVTVGKLFTVCLPWGNVAYRVNIFSAACAAASIALLYKVSDTHLKHNASLCLTQGSDVVIRWDRAKMACGIAAILYGLSPAVMSLARVGEMYTLAAVFAVVIIGAWRIRTPTALGCAAFLLGIGFGIHPTLLFLVPLLVTLKPKEAGVRLVFFCIGFSVVLILWVRSRTGPAQNWGDPSTLENLWGLITRSNYGGLKLHPVESQFSWTLGSAGEQILFFLKSLRHQWGWMALGLGAIGFGRSFKKNKSLALVWVLAGPGFMLLSNLPITAPTTSPILEPYFLLVNVIWTLWVVLGIYTLINSCPSIAGQAVIGMLVLFIPMAELSGSVQSFRNHFYTYDLARNMLRTLPPGAVLFDPDDQIAFTLRMLQLTERRRDDVALLNFFRTRWGYQLIRQRWPDLLPPVPIQSGQELEQALWRYSIKQRPFYTDLPMKITPPLSYGVEGVVYKIQSSQNPSDRASAFYVWRGEWKTPRHPDFFTKHIVNYRAAARSNLGLKYADWKDWALARQYYEEALAIDPTLSAAYNNLGVADFSQGFRDRARKNYQRALRYDPANPGYQQNLDLSQ